MSPYFIKSAYLLTQSKEREALRRCTVFSYPAIKALTRYQSPQKCQTPPTVTPLLLRTRRDKAKPEQRRTQIIVTKPKKAPNSMTYTSDFPRRSPGKRIQTIQSMMQEQNHSIGIERSAEDDSAFTTEMIQASSSPSPSSPNHRTKCVEHQTLNDRSSPSESSHRNSMGAPDQEESTPSGENTNVRSPRDRRTDSNSVSLSKLKFAVLADRTRQIVGTALGHQSLPGANASTSSSQQSLASSDRSSGELEANDEMNFPPLTEREYQELVDTHEALHRFVQDGGSFDTRFASYEPHFDWDGLDGEE
ncbi:MAG: hypothetical protein Q9225_003485 [Loekoesia sp. 1 TL-2023]